MRMRDCSQSLSKRRAFSIRKLYYTLRLANIHARIAFDKVWVAPFQQGRPSVGRWVMKIIFQHAAQFETVSQLRGQGAVVYKTGHHILHIVIRAE